MFRELVLNCNFQVRTKRCPLSITPRLDWKPGYEMCCWKMLRDMGEKKFKTLIWNFNGISICPNLGICWPHQELWAHGALDAWQSRCIAGQTSRILWGASRYLHSQAQIVAGASRRRRMRASPYREQYQAGYNVTQCPRRLDLRSEIGIPLPPSVPPIYCSRPSPGFFTSCHSWQQLMTQLLPKSEEEHLQKKGAADGIVDGLGSWLLRSARTCFLRTLARPTPATGTTAGYGFSFL